MHSDNIVTFNFLELRIMHHLPIDSHFYSPQLLPRAVTFKCSYLRVSLFVLSLIDSIFSVHFNNRLKKFDPFHVYELKSLIFI